MNNKNNFEETTETQGNKITNLIKESLGGIREFMDANTVTGTPIETPSGTVIIPISKVSMGFASGGLDLPAKSEEGNKNFGGGGGTGVTVLPIEYAWDEATLAYIDGADVTGDTADIKANKVRPFAREVMDARACVGIGTVRQTLPIRAIDHIVLVTKYDALLMLRASR
jgi:hypothetical protein